MSAMHCIQLFVCSRTHLIIPIVHWACISVLGESTIIIDAECWCCGVRGIIILATARFCCIMLGWILCTVLVERLDLTFTWLKNMSLATNKLTHHFSPLVPSLSYWLNVSPFIFATLQTCQSMLCHMPWWWSCIWCHNSVVQVLRD